jgi:hypothetical protein
MIGTSSQAIQKARRSAKRVRTFVACARCKTGKTKCSDYRPCKQCSNSKGDIPCSDLHNSRRLDSVWSGLRNNSTSLNANVPHRMHYSPDPNRGFSSIFTAHQQPLPLALEHGYNLVRTAHDAPNISCSRESLESSPPSELHVSDHNTLPDSSSGLILGCNPDLHDCRTIMCQSQRTDGPGPVPFLEGRWAMMDGFAASPSLPESTFAQLGRDFSPNLMHPTTSFGLLQPDAFRLHQLYRPPPPISPPGSFWSATLPPLHRPPPPISPPASFWSAALPPRPQLLPPNLTVPYGGGIPGGLSQPYANALNMVFALPADTLPPSVPVQPALPILSFRTNLGNQQVGVGTSLAGPGPSLP